MWGIGWEVVGELGGGGGSRWGLKTAESCHEQVSFESGFKQRKGRRISEIGWHRVPDRRCKKAEGTSPNVLVLRFGTFRSFSHDK